MATQFNQHKPGAMRVFRQLIHSPNLAALWPLNEKSGNVLDRCTVNRLSGTVNGAPTYSVALGDFWGLTLNGATNSITLGNVSALDLDFNTSTRWSLLAVLNPNISAIGSILSKRLATGNLTGWDWLLSATRVPTFIAQNQAGNRVVVTANAAVANGTPVMLGVQLIGGAGAVGVTLFKNGATDADTDTEDTLSATAISAASANIGRRNGTDQDFNGSIGFVAVWSGRAVPAAEFHAYAVAGGFA